MALCDTTAPTISGDPVVAPGPYGYGSTLYISVPFSEAVNAGSSTTLKTDWGEFAYVSGNGSNVLTFSGVISGTFGSNLTVRQINGTVTDLAGNALSDTSCYKNFSSVTVELPWSGAGTETDPYIITTTAQLDYMAVRVNANYGSDNFSDKYFELGADLTYSYTTDWDDFTPGSANKENNYTALSQNSFKSWKEAAPFSFTGECG